MKYYTLLALQLFFFAHISATVQPTIAQAKDFAKKTVWAFEENKGQVLGQDSAQVKFFYKQGNLTMFLMNGRLAYQFEQWHYPQDSISEPDRRRWKSDEEEYRAHEAYQKKIKRETYRMDIELVGANKNSEIITEGKSHDYIQYYTHDALDVHAYQKITYKNIYPNIDWVIYIDNRHAALVSASFAVSNSQLIKYDFIIHPGADPSLIKLRTHWVEDLNIKPDGSLTFVNRMGSITENPPISFQDEKEIATQFKRDGNTLSFHLGAYDKSQTLVLDPSIAWSTYYGGTPKEMFSRCVVDTIGHIYAGGITYGSTMITAGAHQTVYGGNQFDAFIVKFNSEGKRLWATYYGGNQFETLTSLLVNNSNELYIIGNTNSTNNIATTGSHSPTNVSGNAAFFVKFKSSGVREWGTYCNYARFLNAAIDLNGDVICIGNTVINTGNGPAEIIGTAHQSVFGGKVDGYITKYNANGIPIWSSYYGGARSDELKYCALDKNNKIYAVGTTNSENNISYNGYQNTKAQSDYNTAFALHGDSFNTDHFIVKFSSGGAREWASYYGDSNFVSAPYSGIYCTTDIEDNVYVSFTEIAASTSLLSNDFLYTVKGILQGDRIVLLKLNSDGTRAWSRFCLDTISVPFWLRQSVMWTTGVLGLNDSLILVSGNSRKGSTLKTTGGGWQDSIVESVDCFLQAYDKNGNEIWGSFWGGQGYELLQQVGLGKKSELILVGYTDTNHVPTPKTLSLNSFGIKGFQNTFGGNSDGFLTKICTRLDTPKIEISSNRGTDICGGGQVIFTATDTFEGDDPIYTWYKNGNPIGMDTNTLTMASIQDKDSFRCRLISSATCLFKDTVWSNTLVMKIKAADTHKIFHNICEPQSYSFNNQNLTTSGTYRDTFTSSQGCDSFVFLHLLVKDTSLHEFTYVSPCDSVSYMFDGILRTLHGKFTAIDTNVLGCDSTTVLNLFFRKPTHNRLSPVQICPSTSYVFDGIARTAAGDYIRYYSNADGCPSTDSLRISILNNPTPQTNPISACAPFTFKGKTYTSSATVIDTIKSIVGNCDSVYLSNLIQLKPPPTTASEINHIVCDSIRLNNRLYTNSFSFVDTFRTVGTVCDSVYRKTNYTIRYTPQIGLKERDTFMRGSQVTLRPFSATNYLWSTGETTKNLSFKLTEVRQLYLIAWNEEPCRDTAYISLVAEDLAIVGMPTGFSPTGEYAENRTFRPNINGRLEYFHMMVFNRWGEKVYETFETQPLGWNGIFKGEPAPAGLYGYVLEFRTLGVIYNKSGEVMLVR